MQAMSISRMLPSNSRAVAAVPRRVRNSGMHWLSKKRTFSSTPKENNSSPPSTTTDVAVTETDSVLLEGTISKSLGSIVRHGKGDACIVLNVGGNEFITLRSTVASNPVLADHVARAEANKEIMPGSKSVFIDRDPTHFAFLLQYLRNQVELETAGLPSNASECVSVPGQVVASGEKLTRMIGSWKTRSYMPTLPKDPKVLGELYVEATYYRMTELQNALHDQSTWNKIISFLGLSKVGGLEGNPFVRASELLAQARVALISFGSLVAGGVTIVQSARVMGNETWNSAKALVGGEDMKASANGKSIEHEPSQPAPSV